MCGRFTLTVDPADLQETFQNYTFPEKFAPRYREKGRKVRRKMPIRDGKG